MMKPLHTKIIVFICVCLLSLVVGEAIFLFSLKARQKKDEPTIPLPTQQVLPITKPAQLHVVSGTVKIKRVNEEQIAQKGQDFIVKVGDTVSTDTNTVATVDFNDGTLLRLSSESSVAYQSDDQVISFKQILGNVYYRFKKSVGFRVELNVETDSAVASVRGTSFALFKSLGTKLYVDTHQVELYQKDALGNKLPSSRVMVGEKMSAETATPSAGLDEPLQATASALSNQEKAWLDFNTEADKVMDQDPTFEKLDGLVLTYLKQTLVTPTPAPTATPAITSTPVPTSVPKVTEMFGTGYKSGVVQTDAGAFTLSCIGANKNTTRVITDSANESDCANDCPVKTLAEYVQSNGGFAGINGMYFCPPDYPQCADKKNSYDTLFFNSRLKKYINSDNNVYSVIPFLVIDGGGNPRFVSKAQDWGRDTSISAGTAGNPLLIEGGNYVAEQGSLDDKQRNTKSNRGAFVQKGDNFYLCVTRSATVPDAGHVYQTLHVDNAINIDGGGSTALYVNGAYKFGPGRALPNAIIFANR